MTERDIFIAAMQRGDPGERRAYLDAACRADAALRDRVDGLVAVYARAGSFLESPAGEGAFGGADGGGPAAGDVVAGRYQLVERVGEGGMGEVWLAEQTEPVRRKVAVKLVRPGMGSRQVVARFEAEWQALALMDHPNIATVFDAGSTESGRPYFVMELLKGVPITDYCDRHRLGPRERLGLFVDVCRAVQHAHQKGVIHRDVKPSNVLVAGHDDTPVVKVIDFGVAKVTGEPATDRPADGPYTHLVGTPLYMSPEQAGQGAPDVDTRTDVYALGVLLYELLTGTTPFEGALPRGATYAEIRRVIREEAPPKPSTRVGTLGPAAVAVSANRRSDPKALGRLLRGEPDWIVMKCLAKDRDRRYETASGLAADVGRYLRDEPVSAGPTGAGYRLRKFVWRHRGPVLAASVVLAALVAGLAGATWGLVRADWARREAETARLAEADAHRLADGERRVAEAVRRFLQVDLLRQADPRAQAELVRLTGGEFEARQNPTVKDLLDRAAAELTEDKIAVRFPNQPRVQAEILVTVGNTYLGLGQYAKAVDHLTRARDRLSQSLGPRHPDTLAVRRAVAHTVSRTRPADAIALLEELHCDCAAALGPDHPDTLTTLDNLAVAFYRAGRTADAVALQEKVRDARAAALGPDHPDRLGTLNNLALAYRQEGRLAEATALLEKVRDAKATALGPDHPSTLDTQLNLASTYAAAGKFDRSVPLLEEALRLRKATQAPDHPLALLTMTSLGASYRDAGRLADAARVLEEALALARSRPAAMPPDLRLTLALTYDRGSQFARAEPLYRELVDVARRKSGAGRPPVGVALNRLGLNLVRQGRAAEAEPALRECLAIREKYGPGGWRVFETRAVLGGALLAQKRYAEAEPLLRAGYEGMRERAARVPADSRARLRDALDRLIELADARRDKDAAAKWQQERDAMTP